MSTQRGNTAKKGPPKHQNKTAWKNVYHDTSKRTKQIATTEVVGVCRRCKDILDWKIKYKKYKLLTQPKTCATCKQKAVKNSYHVYCIPCATKANKCAKCGERTDIMAEPSLTAAEQASENRQLQFELELLPERKRRTFLRLQEQGKPTKEALLKLEGKGGIDDFSDDDDYDDDGSDVSEEDESIKNIAGPIDGDLGPKDANTGEIKSDDLVRNDIISDCENSADRDINNHHTNKGSTDNKTVDLAEDTCNTNKSQDLKNDTAQTAENSQGQVSIETVVEDKNIDVSKLDICDRTDS